MTLDYVKNSDGEFVCPHKDCNKVFSRQNTMYYHMKRHNNEFAYNCETCNKGFLQKSAYLQHMASLHAESKTVEVNGEKVTNPYNGVSYNCPCCDYVARTKANSLIHYARIHSDNWIPTYSKSSSSCIQCNKNFSSIAAYLYHCTGCIPTNKHHRDMISRIMESK
jgi:hypothetical protein